MLRWLPGILARIHELAAERKIRLTGKAFNVLRELRLCLDPEDVRDVLMNLTAAESAGRQVSMATGEWMYIFKPDVGWVPAYVKLVLRSSCVVVPFHEDEESDSRGGLEEHRINPRKVRSVTEPIELPAENSKARPVDVAKESGEKDG